MKLNPFTVSNNRKKLSLYQFRHYEVIITKHGIQNFLLRGSLHEESTSKLVPLIARDMPKWMYCKFIDKDK